ncbi:MAG: 3'-5' exonuclease, partial [Pseudomonadota bacterium]|nr:3'-5' exonuclease [Pseudomonadota bacterium]
KESENYFETIPFNLSFRSTKPILDVVNNVLKNPSGRQGILSPGEEAFHISYREKEAGLVEIWPLEQHKATDALPPWKPPVERIQGQSSLTRLADKIADKISQMLQEKEILKSQNRPIVAGDFLILVQRRNQFVTDLVRALKEKNIPVAGIDRLNLSSHIAVQDLIAAAKFALLPEDDLNLACLLKSPLIKMTEDELFQVAYHREGKSLWSSVQEVFPKIALILTDWLNHADKCPPYEFFDYILGPCGGKKALIARLGGEANEAINEFLNLVLSFEQTHIPALENIVRLMNAQDIEIKRDMESSQNAVRIMTVHGSKGLQGNIVFLPQTRYIKPNRSSFVWINGIPLWVPNQELSSLKTDEILDMNKAKNADENHRLLYVALTRARDRLYICGYDGAKKPSDDNWYDLICGSLKQYTPDADGIIRISSEQTEAVTPTDSEITPTLAALPDWAYRPAQTETTPQKPLNPSHSTDQEPTPDSALSSEQAMAMARGSFIHRLLQYLPEIPPDKWAIAIQRLKPTDIDIPDNLEALLHSEKFAPLFGKGSVAEVPVVGVWQNQAISGQIDRLIVREKEVWIVDFKTNRHVPKTNAEVPKMYQNQLRAYRGLISQIFSDKVVRTFLLWTENLTLMEIENEN